jgi:hypothetical protein
MHELTLYPNWVVTYPHDKIPLNPFTGNRADVTDPTTWADYATASACVSAKKHLVLGFVLTNSPFSCVDLDTYKTTDPTITNTHQQLARWFDTYSEISPNGGTHLWCVGKLGIDGKRVPQQFVEVYSNKRYITVTKQSANGHTRIEDRQSTLDQFLTWITHEQRAQVTQPNSSPEVNADEEVCKMAASALNGELFKELYVGNWYGRYDSQSEADLAFVNIVAYYTDSKEQTARIFHNSQLGKRAKAHRTNYLYDAKYGIITRAFDQKLPNIYFKDIENAIRAKVQGQDEVLKTIMVPPEEFQSTIDAPKATPEGVKKMNKLPEFIRQELDLDFSDFPPGLTGDIAKFIYRNSYRPVKEIAIAGSIAFMAGMCGRFYNISNMGLNHYIAILAPTGTGKEGAAIGIERIRKAVEEKLPGFKLFTGPDAIASSQALMRHLATESPCCVSRIGEMGQWINRLCSKRANENVIMLRSRLLDLYTRSGWGQVVREEIRADKKNTTPSVKAPAFSLYGDSTTDVFYSSLDEDQLDEGLISRFLIIECNPNPDCMYNEFHGAVEPESAMIDKIAGIANYVLRGQTAELNKDIDMTPEAAEALTAFRVECDAKCNENRNSPEAKVYTRANERLLRLAGLVAVGVNPECPVITIEVVNWAKKLILRTVASVVMRFEKGEVGESNLYIGQRKAMVQILRQYWNRKYSDFFLKQYNINREMFDAKIVTANYINDKVRSHQAFRKARNMAIDIRNVLTDLIHEGILIAIKMDAIRDSARTGVAYYIKDLILFQE